MSRLELRTPNQAQLVVEGLYKDLERRIESSPPGLCPVDMSRAFLEICHAQSCGKCVPCRVGLGQLKNLITDVLDGKATIRTLTAIEETAKSIMESADCAIGYEAANMVYKGAIGFKDDYVEHIMYHRCLSTLKQPVPCVSRCPARVDIPGYIALVREGRYEDAIRLIRKDNPFPTTCGFICEHPCEALCRRNMIDDAVNIRGLKRMAADAAGYVAPPACAESTGKNIAVVGGGILQGSFIVTLFTCVRLILNSLVMDKVHTAYTYTALNIFTTSGENISKEILDTLNRGCTIFKGTGAYTHQEHTELYCVLSTYEVDKAISIIKKYDDHAFVVIAPIKKVSGNFIKKTIV